MTRLLIYLFFSISSYNFWLF